MRRRARQSLFANRKTREYLLIEKQERRNVWVNEIVINDIEIRPMDIPSLEFDDEGTALISFIAITPGS
jgi:hypothetical protein